MDLYSDTFYENQNLKKKLTFKFLIQSVES